MAKKGKGRVEKFNRNNQLLDFKKAKKEREKAAKAAKKARKAELRRQRKEPPATEAERKHRERIRKKNNRKRLLVAVVTLVVVLVVGFSTYGIVEMKMQQKKLITKQEQLKEKKKSLQKELDTVNAREYIEQQARKQLKLILPGETLYMLEKKNKE